MGQSKRSVKVNYSLRIKREPFDGDSFFICMYVRESGKSILSRDRNYYWLNSMTWVFDRENIFI